MWNALQPIQAPQVVGSIPAVPPSQSGNSLASGLMQGIAQGQNIGLNKQAAQLNAMKLQQAQQAQADDTALRQAAPQGSDAYLKALVNQGKMQEAQQYQSSQLLYQNALLQNKTSVLDLNDKEHKAADTNNVRNVTVFSRVSQLPAEQQETTYQKYRADLLKQYPDAVMPDHFTPDTFASVMRTNDVITNSKQIQATESVKTMTQLQALRDNLTLNKAQYEKAGRPTDGIDKAIKEVQSKLDREVGLQNQAAITPNDLQKNQDRRSMLKDKIDNGTATANDKQAYDELNKVIKKETDKGGLGGIIDSISNTVTGAKNAIMNGLGGAPTAAIPAGRITVQAPDGTVGHIPAAQLNEAMKAGYKQLKQ